MLASLLLLLLLVLDNTFSALLGSKMEDDVIVILYFQAIFVQEALADSETIVENQASMNSRFGQLPVHD